MVSGHLKFFFQHCIRSGAILGVRHTCCWIRWQKKTQQRHKITSMSSTTHSCEISYWQGTVQYYKEFLEKVSLAYLRQKNHQLSATEATLKGKKCVAVFNSQKQLSICVPQKSTNKFLSGLQQIVERRVELLLSPYRSQTRSPSELNKKFLKIFDKNMLTREFPSFLIFLAFLFPPSEKKAKIWHFKRQIGRGNKKAVPLCLRPIQFSITGEIYQQTSTWQYSGTWHGSKFLP